MTVYATPVDIDEFCVRYLACRNEIQAYREVFKGRADFDGKLSPAMARQFFKSAPVANRLAEKSAEILAGKRLDAKAILERLAKLAFADSGEIVKVRRVNCRHCWGKKFRRQMTQGEYDDQCADALDRAMREGKEDYNVPPEPVGGLGFQATRAPHPDCPECGGEGFPEVFIQDFDKVSDDAKPLIAGAKMGKYGLEVSLHSQADALTQLAKCFGLMQPEVAIQIIQQFLPAAGEKEVFDTENVAEAAEIYQRIANGPT
jgi:hypothetical protein